MPPELRTLRNGHCTSGVGWRRANEISPDGLWLMPSAINISGYGCCNALAGEALNPTNSLEFIMSMAFKSRLLRKLRLERCFLLYYATFVLLNQIFEHMFKSLGSRWAVQRLYMLVRDR